MAYQPNWASAYEPVAAFNSENASYGSGGHKRGLAHPGQESAMKRNRAALQELSANTASLAAPDDYMMIEDCSYASTTQAPSYVQYQPMLQERQASHAFTSSSHQPGERCQHLQGHASVVDIDYNNRNNPLACSEYAVSIFNHLHEAELNRRPNPRYMETVQTEVTAHMRSVLIDWLVEVAQEYKLCSDTLFQAVTFLDRLLSVRRIPREKLQLAGIACMWIAAKYEEIYAPTSKDFCYITDNTYSQAELVDMEAGVLAALNFELTQPTAKTFLRRYLQAANADERLHYLASYLCELSLLHAPTMEFLPSQVAAGCVLLANRLLGLPTWTPTLEHYSGFHQQDVTGCAQALARLHADACSADFAYGSVRDKYAGSAMCGVSSLAPLPTGVVAML